LSPTFIGANPILDVGDDRQFGEEQLVARGEADSVRTAHASYFRGSEPTSSRCGTARPAVAYEWFAAELANLARRVPLGRSYGDLGTPSDRNARGIIGNGCAL